MSRARSLKEHFHNYAASARSCRVENCAKVLGEAMGAVGVKFSIFCKRQQNKRGMDRCAKTCIAVNVLKPRSLANPAAQ